VHAIYRTLDGINETIGKTVAWFTLAMVIVQFIVVLMRYVFAAPDFLGISTIWWQELIVYLHGSLIMLAAGYTFLHNGHVRVDIFYREASTGTKDWTDLLGSLLFLLPMCYVIWWSAWPNVVNSWASLEGSTETSGIPYKYVLKSTVLAIAVVLAIQAISTALKAAMRLAGHEVDDPHRDEESLD
jgi:TRAP-type mannitol/chloroaromatic compound transport system permease small subunit